MERERCTDPAQNLGGINWEFMRCNSTGGDAGHPPPAQNSDGVYGSATWDI